MPRGGRSGRWPGLSTRLRVCRVKVGPSWKNTGREVPAQVSSTIVSPGPVTRRGCGVNVAVRVAGEQAESGRAPGQVATQAQAQVAATGAHVVRDGVPVAVQQPVASSKRRAARLHIQARLRQHRRAKRSRLAGAHEPDAQLRIRGDQQGLRCLGASGGGRRPPVDQRHAACRAARVVADFGTPGREQESGRPWHRPGQGPPFGAVGKHAHDHLEGALVEARSPG